MQDDTRCCGTGTCLINAEGMCWCGQQWDGEKMCFAAPPVARASTAPSASVSEALPPDPSASQ